MRKYIAQVILITMAAQTISYSGFIAFASDELVSKNAIITEDIGDFDTLSLKTQSQMVAQAKSLQSNPRL